MLSWLYPGVCELCGERAEGSLCPRCLETRLTRLPRPLCLYCGAPVASTPEDPMRCPGCIGRPRTFSFARSALQRTPEAMQLIHELKYHHANHLAPALAPLLAELWEQHPPLRAHADWALVPVPAAPQHLFTRGYNQAEELARALGKLKRLRVVQPLQRRGGIRASQTMLGAAQRQANAFESYSALPPYAKGRRLLPPHLLLIDDVYTTGATARACAQALMQLPGVELVGVLSVIRIDRQGGQRR